MPLAERDLNASGRTSRASDMSIAECGPSRASGAIPKPSDVLSTGIASMLRTSTEMGNLGGITVDPYVNVPRGPPRRGSRLSVASSHSNHSNRMHGHRQHSSYTSTGTRRSRENIVPQYVADTLSPTTMHLPLTSPMMPRAGRPRNGDRSQSLTTAHTSAPAFQLAQHRSMASMRSMAQRPSSRGQYGYPPPAPRMPGNRTASPAISDNPGFRPLSRNGPGYVGAPGLHQQPRPMRRRIPSDPSLRHDDRGYGASMTYYGDIGPGIPPVPTLVPRRRAEYESTGVFHRSLRSQRSYNSAFGRSAKDSFSSGSFNQRNDSDPPSSDATSPPTPQGSTSMDRLIGRPGTHFAHKALRVKEEPAYYDGSEEFYDQPVANIAPTGSVDRMAIIQERGTPDHVVIRRDDASVAERTMGALAGALDMPDDIPELPASPVPRRLTRELVKSQIGPASPTDHFEPSGGLTETNSTGESTQGDQDEEQSVETARVGIVISSTQTRKIDMQRHSILSQAGSSILESSTLEFAVQSSIPVLADNGITMDTDDRTAPVQGSDAEPTTEDGMSDLLDGYQHTDTKPEFVDEDASVDKADERVNHAAKSSDAQSFKSCTDLPDTTEHAIKKSDAGSSRISSDLPAPEAPFKDSDARSFKTCKDIVTPDRPASLLVSRLPSSNMVSFIASEPKLRGPISEASVLSSLASGGQLPLPSRSEPNVLNSDTMAQANSKFKSTMGSAATSSSSFAIENGLRQPPVVPPRQSSSGKEAQRSNAMFNNFFAAFRSRNSSASSRKAAKKEAAEKEQQYSASQDIPTPPPMRERPFSGDGRVATANPTELLKAPETALKNQDVLPRKATDGNIIAAGYNASDGLGPAETPSVKTPSDAQQHSLDTPSSVIHHPSPLVSPDHISSRGRVSSLPAMSPETPVHRRRESQTTTHLAWPVRTHVNPAVDQYFGFRASFDNQEDTTTALKLTAYKRYPPPPRSYLPDVKEESHEDSSLNTSASNLKHSSFRFGVASQPDVRVTRVSLDEALDRGHASLFASTDDACDGGARLPSLNFSKSNLWSSVVIPSRGSRASQSLEFSREGCAEDRGGEVSDSSAKRNREKYLSVFRAFDTSEVTQPGTEHQVSRKRTLSPKLFEELESLSVPTVDGLTERFSEYLPTLKSTDGSDGGGITAEEVILEHTMEEIHDVGGPASKRSNARLRPIPGSTGLVVVEDALYAKLTGDEKENWSSASGGRESISKRELGDIGATKGRSWSVAHARPRDSNPPGATAEVQTPPSAVLPTRSLSAGHNNNTVRSSLESRLSSQSFNSATPAATVTDTAPWFNQKNYSSWNRDVDIGLPSQTAARVSPRPGPSHLRHRISDASSAGTLTADNTTAFLYSTAGAFSIPGNGSKTFRRTSQQANNTSEPGFDRNCFPLAPVHIRDKDQSHGAGERYPTSALALPSDLHLPGADSSFSLYSDGELEHPTTRKPIFGLKSRRSSRTPATRSNATRIQEFKQSSNLEASVTEQSAHLPSRSNRNTFTGVSGMNKVRYFARQVQDFGRRFVNRIRRLGHRNRPTAPPPIQPTEVQLTEDTSRTPSPFQPTEGTIARPSTPTQAPPLYSNDSAIDLEE